MKKTVLLLLLSFVIVWAGAQRKKQPVVKKTPVAQNSKEPLQQGSSQGMKYTVTLLDL